MALIRLILITLVFFGAVLSATPRELDFDASYLSELLTQEQEYRFHNAALAPRRVLATPLVVRFSAPGLGRVRAVYTKIRRFGPQESWSAVNFQGELQYQDGSSQPVTMSVGLDDLKIFPILDKQGRAIDISTSYPFGFDQGATFSMRKRRDADWHEGLGDCGQEVSSHTVSGLLQPQLAAASVRTVKIEMEGDAELVAAESDPTGYIDAILAAVEAIYERDLSVTFDKEKETLFSDSNTQPYTETNGENLLEQVRTNNLSETVNLTHLITGKDTFLLDDSNNQQFGLAGVAYTGVVCSSTFNAGYSERASSSTTTTVTMAHEVGHNFNASHPDPAEGFIMDAVGTPTTESAFSTFSQNEVNQYINQQGTCLTSDTVNSPTLSINTNRKKGTFAFNVTFQEDRSACTMALALAENLAFTGTIRTFSGFAGRAASAVITASKKRRSKADVYARVTVNCGGTEVSSDATLIPNTKKIKTKKKKKLPFKKFSKLKKVQQTV